MLLHSNKVAKEKNLFIKELYSSLPIKNRCISGNLKDRARTLHRIFLPIYILNKYKEISELSTDYFRLIVSQAIEAESSLILGFKTLGMASLRSLLESNFKFLYYEYHPIEYYLHINGEYELPNIEYKNFLYKFPNSQKVKDLKKDNVDTVWTTLCGYAHSNLKSITPLTYVEDIETIFTLSENKWQTNLRFLKKIIRISIIIPFMVDNDWAKNIEKSYFDEIFRLFNIDEKQLIKTTFKVT